MDVPFLEVSGSGYEIGLAIGRTFSDRVRAFLEFKRRQASTPAGPRPEHFEQAGALLLEWCRKRAPHLIDELHGYAEGSGVRFDDIIFLNCSDEVRARATLTAGDGCTAFALHPDATGGGILAGQSKDGQGRQYDHFVVLLMRPTGRAAVLQLVYPGMLALLGLSETGMTIFTNQIYDGTGVDAMPIMLIKRLVWEMDRVEQAEALLASSGVATANNFLFCDRHGQAVCLELKGNSYARVDPEDGMILHTNHYLGQRLQGGEDKAAIRAYRSRERLSRLRELFEQRRGEITPDFVFDCYRDHDGAPRSICAHETPDEDYSTTAVLVAETEAGRLHVCIGKPCENEPQVYGI